MRILFPGIIVVLSLLVVSKIGAQDYYAGIQAFKRGDYAAAMREWKALADQGQPLAQFNLGVLHENGQGVPQDYVQAFKWYHKAAEQGEAGSQSRLGSLYRKGNGVAQNYAAALMWYRRAAEQGNATAQHNLGFMYDRGLGVLQDNVITHMWYSLAAAQGNKMAANDRGIVSEEMSHAAIEEAQRLANECLVRNYRNCGR